MLQNKTGVFSASIRDTLTVKESSKTIMIVIERFSWELSYYTIISCEKVPYEKKGNSAFVLEDY